MNIRRVVMLSCLASAQAFAQPSAPQPMPTMPAMPAPAPTADPAPGAGLAPRPPAADTTASAGKKADAPKKKEPGRGDFDAGGQARFPSGPDETGGNYQSFNWVA